MASMGAASDVMTWSVEWMEGPEWQHVLYFVAGTGLETGKYENVCSFLNSVVLQRLLRGRKA